MKYNRVLLKLSGESLMGKQSYGIAPEMLEQYALDIKAAVEAGGTAAKRVGELMFTPVIPRPHSDVEQIIPNLNGEN